MPPLAGAIIPAIPSLPPGGAVEGMALSASAPGFAEIFSRSTPTEPVMPESAAPAEVPHFGRPDASSSAFDGSEAAAGDSALKPDEAVVPFVERRSAMPIATRAIFPAPKAEGIVKITWRRRHPCRLAASPWRPPRIARRWRASTPSCSTRC